MKLHQEVRAKAKACRQAPPTSRLGQLRERARGALEDSSVIRKIKQKLNPDDTQAPEYA